MKKREGDAWMPADDFGRTLKGLGLNLLVADIEAALVFQREVLEADVVYSDPDFAVLKRGDAIWMLHADHTYLDHPLIGSLSDDIPRGIGAELRLYDCDPDAAEARARALDFTVLAGAMDKPHGLREAFIIDGDGYMWVPSAATAKGDGA
jgi:hypothetical protein